MSYEVEIEGDTSDHIHVEGDYFDHEHPDVNRHGHLTINGQVSRVEFENGLRVKSEYDLDIGKWNYEVENLPDDCQKNVGGVRRRKLTVLCKERIGDIVDSDEWIRIG